MWWTATLFTFGSLIFVVCSILLLVPSLRETPSSRVAIGVIIAAGSVIYFLGGTCQVLELMQDVFEPTDKIYVANGIARRVATFGQITVWQSLRAPKSNQQKAKLLARQYANLERLAHLILWVGTLLFQVNSFGASNISTVPL